MKNFYNSMFEEIVYKSYDREMKHISSRKEFSNYIQNEIELTKKETFGKETLNILFLYIEHNFPQYLNLAKTLFCFE